MLRGEPALYYADSSLLVLISGADMSPQTDPRLIEAAERHNVDELNDLIRSNVLILEDKALRGVSHKPLHIGCVTCHLNFTLGPPQVDAEGCREENIREKNEEEIFMQDALAFNGVGCSFQPNVNGNFVQSKFRA